MRLEEFLEVFDARANYIRQFNIPESVEIYFTCMRRYYENILAAKEQGKPLAWVSIISPMEIFHAMDIVPFAIDPYAITVAAFAYFKKEDCKYFELGDAWGYPPDACSPHRLCVGLAAEGVLPAPDLLYAPSPMPCDSAVAVFDVLADITKAPVFFANYEYRRNPNGMYYLANEFRELVKFLEQVTGKKLDTDRLREIVKTSTEATNIMLDIQQLRKKLPCPLRARDAFNSFGMRIAGLGMQDSLHYYQVQLKEVMGRVERGEGALPEERFRLVASGAYPFFAMDIIDWIQNEFKAIFVADFLNCRPAYKMEDTEIDDPIEYLARRNLRAFGIEINYGPCEVVIDDIIRNIEEARVDGSFFFTHFGCKQGCGLQKIYRDKIMERVGIPTVFIDMDISDPKIVSVDQMKNKISNYMDMLAKGRG